mgnify:CR=1 FL=1
MRTRKHVDYRLIVAEGYALRGLKAGARAYIMRQDGVRKVVDAIRRIRNGQLDSSPSLRMTIRGVCFRA